MNRDIPRVLKFAFAAAGLVVFSIQARADDPAAPKPNEITPDQARCQAMGEGFYAVRGSTQCLRIGGYISAGVGFIQPTFGSTPKNGPFGARTTTFSDSQAGISVESRFDTELGPGRAVLEVRGLNVDVNR